MDCFSSFTSLEVSIALLTLQASMSAEGQLYFLLGTFVVVTFTSSFCVAQPIEGLVKQENNLCLKKIRMIWIYRFLLLILIMSVFCSHQPYIILHLYHANALENVDFFQDGFISLFSLKYLNRDLNQLVSFFYSYHGIFLFLSALHGFVSALENAGCPFICFAEIFQGWS